MKKITKIIAAATAVLLTMGVAGCTKDSSGNIIYPNFINPSQAIGGGNEEQSERYVINVVSEGGFRLDGVQVSAVRNNITIKRGISQSGKIELALPLGEYKLVVDESSLPAGYYLRGDENYVTNSERRDEVTIKIASKVIPANSGEVSTYALGTIMRDFTFRDAPDSNGDSRTYILSDLLKTRKAVVINFFFTTCGPCQAEFPAIQEAYTKRPTKDIELIAISSTRNGDSDSTVRSFATTRGLTFPIGMDPVGLTSAFGVSGFPTTIIIDRYGMIAYRSSGTETQVAFWNKLFNDFTSNTYVQNIQTGKPGDGDDTIWDGDRERPDQEMPASAVLEAAANGTAADGTPLRSTFSAEKDEFSWPWVAGAENGTPHIESTNKGKGNSYAIVHSKFTMQEGDVLSLEYNVSSEPNKDKLYVMLDGEILNGEGWSGHTGWQSADLYVSDREKVVDLAITYIKDPADTDTSGDDVAKIRNIHLASKNSITTALDIMRPCASGEIKSGKYSHYVEYEAPAAGSDGFYRTKDGALIYLTVSQLTPWSDLHTGNQTMDENGTTYASTLFNMTANQFFSDNHCVIGDKDITSIYTTYVLIKDYMPAPYYLIPLTEDLKTWAEAFIHNYENGTEHENEWLEFCFYYDHYGPEHEEGETCNVSDDYTRGLMIANAYTAYEKSDLQAYANGEIELEDTSSYNAETGRNIARIDFPLQQIHNGTYYKFTAKSAGVYQIRSYTTGCSPTADSTEDNANSYVTPQPEIIVYSQTGAHLSSSSMPMDMDSETGENYEGFNHYITLNEGQTVYLYLETERAQKTYYDFEITYRGERYEKMMFCSTGGGMWTWHEDDEGNVVNVYLGIRVAYDDITDKYYATDRSGKIDYDKPVYIDMIHRSFLYNNIPKYTFASLQFMINDNAFRNHIFGGEMYQPKMREYLGTALARDEDDPLYGLVEANQEIVNILNAYIDENVDGGMGDGRGWLAWAVYNEVFGK